LNKNNKPVISAQAGMTEFFGFIHNSQLQRGEFHAVTILSCGTGLDPGDNAPHNAN
jgi:hypothetical protein